MLIHLLAYPGKGMSLTWQELAKKWAKSQLPSLAKAKDAQECLCMLAYNQSSKLSMTSVNDGAASTSDWVIPVNSVQKEDKFLALHGLTYEWKVDTISLFLTSTKNAGNSMISWVDGTAGQMSFASTVASFLAMTESWWTSRSHVASKSTTQMQS